MSEVKPVRRRSGNGRFVIVVEKVGRGRLGLLNRRSGLGFLVVLLFLLGPFVLRLDLMVGRVISNTSF